MKFDRVKLTAISLPGVATLLSPELHGRMAAAVSLGAGTVLLATVVALASRVKWRKV